MKKILITGGSGFIGTNFVNFISKKKAKILNIDKLSIVSTQKNLKKFPIEINIPLLKIIYKTLIKYIGY